MTIELKHVGKKFNKDWIFYDVNLLLHNGHHYAFLGPNGSGKSTLLQVIATCILADEGELIYKPTTQLNPSSAAPLNPENIISHIAYCAPYMQLIEEFNLLEALNFHNHFKPFIAQHTIPEIIEILELKHATYKPLKHYSSGMKQRVKLGIAILSNTPILFLDEPLTNLDADATQWYYQLIQKFCTHKTLLIASNRPDEFEFATHQFNMKQFKKKSKIIL